MGNEWGMLTCVSVNVWLDMRTRFPANVLIYTEMREDFVVLIRSSELSTRESHTTRIEVGVKRGYLRGVRSE